MSGRFLSTVLVAGLLVVLTLGGLSVAGTAQGVFRAAMQTSPPTLDPHMTTTTATQQIAVHVFETLVTFGEDYSTILPVLAKSWEVSPNNLVYTFRLEEKAKFHTGKSLTAGDVAASYRRIKEFSPIGGEFGAVERIDVLGTRIVRFVLNRPVDLIRVMAGPVTWQAIMPQSLVEAAGAEELKIPNLIGTGPYKLKEWRPGVHVLVEKFEEYIPYTNAPRSGFGGQKIAHFDEVRFMPVTEVGARIAGLETGTYDYAEALPVATLNRLQANANITPRIQKPLWALVWELNQSEPPMDNVKFRQAVLAALNMEEVNRTVAMNDPAFYRTQPSFWYPEQTLLHNREGDVFYNQSDPERARRLLEEAGYQGEDIILLSNRDYDWMYRHTLTAAAQLERAGIKIRLEFSDWPSQIGKALSMKGWHINQTGFSYWFGVVHAQGSFMCDAPYSYGYCNTEMDALLGQAALKKSDEELRELAMEIQRLAYEDVPLIRFGDYFGLEAVRANVTGFASWYVTPRFWGVRK
ncbi:MAG: ABC transporter substrate-binding protein [Candidatus Bipolaricaulia bacterium]